VWGSGVEDMIKAAIDYVKAGISWMWAALWALSWLAALSVIYFNCTAGTAVGYVNHICQTGFGIIDIVGLLCCAPVYLLIIIVLGIGSKIF
jgi:hypothetical protein